MHASSAHVCVQDIQVIPGTSNPKLCMLSDEYSPSVAVFNCDFDHASCGEVRAGPGAQWAACPVPPPAGFLGNGSGNGSKGQGQGHEPFRCQPHLVIPRVRHVTLCAVS